MGHLDNMNRLYQLHTPHPHPSQMARQIREEPKKVSAKKKDMLPKKVSKPMPAKTFEKMSGNKY